MKKNYFEEFKHYTADEVEGEIAKKILKQLALEATKTYTDVKFEIKDGIYIELWVTLKKGLKPVVVISTEKHNTDDMATWPDMINDFLEKSDDIRFNGFIYKDPTPWLTHRIMKEISGEKLVEAYLVYKNTNIQIFYSNKKCSLYSLDGKIIDEKFHNVDDLKQLSSNKIKVKNNNEWTTFTTKTIWVKEGE